MAADDGRSPCSSAAASRSLLPLIKSERTSPHHSYRLTCAPPHTQSFKWLASHDAAAHAPSADELSFSSFTHEGCRSRVCLPAGCLAGLPSTAAVAASYRLARGRHSLLLVVVCFDSCRSLVHSLLLCGASGLWYDPCQLHPKLTSAHSLRVSLASFRRACLECGVEQNLSRRRESVLSSRASVVVRKGRVQLFRLKLDVSLQFPCFKIE